MGSARRLVGIALLAIASSLTVVYAAEQTAPARVPAAARTTTLTLEEMEKFLLTAKVVSSRPVGTGVTKTRRVTMSDGVLTHDAQVQTVDESRSIYRVQGYTEFNFRDCYCYNIAAYRLAQLLEIDNVPVSVERRMDGQPAAVTWWLDDVAMDEEGRRKKSAADSNLQRADHQRYRQHLFDELIQNRDRNLGNILYTTDWKMWMIDHTRAFRLGRDLMKPDELVRVERTLFERLKALTPEGLKAAVGTHLSKGEIEAVIARRDAIVKVFEAKMAARGENAALYTYALAAAMR